MNNKLFKIFINKELLNKGNTLTMQLVKKAEPYLEDVFYEGYKLIDEFIEIYVKNSNNCIFATSIRNIKCIDGMPIERIASAYDYDIEGNKTYNFFKDKKAGRPKRRLMSNEYPYYVLNKRLGLEIENICEFLNITDGTLIAWLNKDVKVPDNYLKHIAKIDEYVVIKRLLNEKFKIGTLNNLEMLDRELKTLRNNHTIIKNKDLIKKKMFMLKAKY